MISIFAVYAFFSIGIICNKYMLAGAAPFTVFTLRLLLIGIGTTAISIISKQKLPSLTHWYLFLQTIIFAITLPGLCRIWSLQYMPPYKLALITNLGPFLMYFFTLFIDRHTFQIKKILGLMIAFCSIIPLIIAPAPHEDLLHIYAHISLPEIVLFCALIFRAIGLFSLRNLINNYHYSPLIVNNISMLGSCILSMLSMSLESTLTLPTNTIFYSVLFIAVCTSIAGHTLHTYSIKNYALSTITFCSFSLTIFTTLLDYLIFNQSITWHFFTGLIGIIIGLFLFCYNKKERHNTKRVTS